MAEHSPVAVVDLAWTTREAVDLGTGRRARAGAVWHLPDGRPGYVDVYEPGYLEGTFRPDRGKRIGRWTEDTYTKPAFDLARAGGVKQARTWFGARTSYQRVYSATNYPISFDAQGAELLDRATILMVRSVLTGDTARAVDAKANDKLIEPGASQETKNKAGGTQNAATPVARSRALVWMAAVAAAAAAALVVVARRW